MKSYRFLLPMLSCCFTILSFQTLSAGPQDRWHYVTNYTGFSSPMGMALGTNGLIFVAELGANQIRTIDTDGNTITNWTGFNAPRDVAVSTNGLVYVSDSGNNMIKVFDHAGNAVTNWGSAGTNSGAFSTPTSVSILPSGDVVVADGGNHRIQVFGEMGTFIRTWGEVGVFEGQFRDAYGTYGTVFIHAEVGDDGLVYVSENRSSVYNDGDIRIQAFSSDGTYLRNYFTDRNASAVYISKGLKDFFFYDGHNGNGSRGFDAHSNADGAEKLQQFFNGYVSGHAVENAEGELFIATGGAIYKYKRYYRHKVYNPDANNDIPVPVVTKAEQRPGTAWMDIDYIVYDGNDTHVSAGVLAFVNSGSSLSDIIRPATFEENTATNIGQNIKSGVKHHLTWNVTADWSVDYSDLQIEVLARDTRGLMDFQFITIPSNGPNPELTINKSALGPADLLHVWIWLVAVADPAIELVAGSVIGQSGAYAGKTLASGTSTTVDGRAFLFERFNVVEATTDEKNLAIAARAIVGNESTYWVKPEP